MVFLHFPTARLALQAYIVVVQFPSMIMFCFSAITSPSRHRCPAAENVVLPFKSRQRKTKNSFLFDVFFFSFFPFSFSVFLSLFKKLFKVNVKGLLGCVVAVVVVVVVCVLRLWLWLWLWTRSETAGKGRLVGCLCLSEWVDWKWQMNMNGTERVRHIWSIREAACCPLPELYITAGQVSSR